MGNGWAQHDWWAGSSSYLGSILNRAAVDVSFCGSTDMVYTLHIDAYIFNVWNIKIGSYTCFRGSQVFSNPAVSGQHWSLTPTNTKGLLYFHNFFKTFWVVFCCIYTETEWHTGRLSLLDQRLVRVKLLVLDFME